MPVTRMHFEQKYTSYKRETFEEEVAGEDSEEHKKWPEDVFLSTRAQKPGQGLE